ncbi:MAG: A24 family peptidase [Planctomycetota bacterium]
MITAWTTLPIGVRYAVLALVGLVVGAIANHVIYRCAWYSRPIGPWGKPHPDASVGSWRDRVPVLGWWAMRRDHGVHGSGFWIRPLLIELAMAAGIPWLYWAETQTQMYVPAAGVVAPFWLHFVFASHVLLVALMVPATFIDFDEQTIPDAITIPGTLAGLVLATFSLYFFAPAVNAAGGIQPITFNLPAPLDLKKWMGPAGLRIAILVWTGWCFALLNRRVILRRGLAKAVEYFVASLFRYPTWKLVAAMWVVGFFAIFGVHSLGGNHWVGLLTSLIGLGVGGGVVWTIRIVGSLAMGREALGFGDVTLMAMIGAFVGWQAAVMSFFLAPIAAIAIVLVYYLITRNSEIPFGPYLCAGTMLTLFGWKKLVAGWFLSNLAILGPFMLWLFLALAAIMGVMLYFWRIFKEAYLYE